MTTLAELVERHKANKPAMYLPIYEELLAPLRDRPVRVLELGIDRGGSLLVWHDYFRRGIVVGLDRQLPDLGRMDIVVGLYEGLGPGGMAMVAGEQDDTTLLEGVIRHYGPFDLIIDDCAHVGVTAAHSFGVLWPALRSGGLYAVEDWGTGYWPNWEDGAEWTPGHRAGMVGFIKGLVDMTGRQMRADSGIDRLVISAGLAVAVRA